MRTGYKWNTWQPWYHPALGVSGSLVDILLARLTLPSSEVRFSIKSAAISTEMAAHFVPPPTQDNNDGWGPLGIPDRYKDLPYQPFSKACSHSIGPSGSIVYTLQNVINNVLISIFR